MNESTRPEPLLSTNALLFFLLPTMGMMLVTSNGIGQYFAGSGLLVFSLLSVVGPLLYIVIGRHQNNQTNQRRFWWALTVCVVLVVGLTIRQLGLRTNSSVAGIYDGAVQAEVAAAKLLAGEMPYGANYQGTDYESLNPPVVGGPIINVAWSHFIYPPLVFLLYVPIQLARTFIGPLADYRLITVGALSGVTAILILTATTWTQRTRATLLTLGNPLLWISVIIGGNDIIAALCLVAATVLIIHQRWWWSGVVFGLALAAKQPVWPLFPLWLIWLWRMTNGTKSPTDARRQGVLGILISAAAMFGPFLLWHPGGVIDDLVRYATVSVPHAYPISGITFLQYLTVFRLVDSPWAIVPTYLFQLIVGIPVLFFVGRWIQKNSSPAHWLAGAGLLMMSIMLFNRYFNSNFFVMPVVLFVAAHLLAENNTASEV